MNDLAEQIARYVKQLRKTRKLKLHVTTVVRSDFKPRQAMLYAVSDVFSIPQSKAFIIGTLSHFAYDVYYDLKITDASNESINMLIDNAILLLKEERPKEYDYFLKNKDQIIAPLFKYVKTFIRWASYNPVPFDREPLLDYGVLTGRIDRVDDIANRILITDYKTSSIDLKGMMLESYKMQVGGGYVYLVQKTQKYPNKELLPPRIVVFRNATWVTHVIDEYEHYVVDFEYSLRQATKMIVQLARGIIPEDCDKSECFWCSLNVICKKLR